MTTAGGRAVVWLPRASGRRRAVEVAIDPAQVDQALGKWRQLLGPDPNLHVSVYLARPDAGPPNPVLGLPDLGGDPAAALAEHLVGPHGLGGETTAWLGRARGAGRAGRRARPGPRRAPWRPARPHPPHPVVTPSTGAIGATVHGQVASSGARPGLQISHQISLHFIIWRLPRSHRWWPGRLSGGHWMPRLASLVRLPTPSPASTAAGSRWRPGPPGDPAARSWPHPRAHPHPRRGAWT
jgi:hypothetical protein